MNVISVSELTSAIKSLLENNHRLAALFVRGELSNYKRYQSGHCYFTLKDSGAVIRGVMFRSRAQYLKFEPRDGMKVIVAGHIAVYERDGQYQLYADQLIPDGVGELSLAYAQLKDKLSREGLFDDNRKRALPVLPKTVGVITSPNGAALRDIITVSKRRHGGVRLVLYPARVQGMEAPGEICRALDVFNRLYPVDIIIVGRGGGSLEELWAFNDEKVVRAIAASTIPVISAVGHETDFTLSDFVADRRAATPSQAAELIVPDVRELSRYIGALTSTLETGMKNLLRNHKQKVVRLQNSRALRSPQDILAARQQAVDVKRDRLLQAFRTIVAGKQQSFHVAAGKLAVLNPLAVLNRGYSVTRKLDGTIIRRVSDIEPGEMVEIILRDGLIAAQVSHKEETSEKNKK
ncbi:MAG: Exodeoxyribonuclease 7 large subunit [Anaerosporomusa subterranea]|nr:Exodeoxyribonuclease 7 large subunit [Anaerosporomusa subterranea]